MTSLAGPQLALLCAIVACAYVVEGLAGFGATVLSLTLGALLVPIGELRLVLLALGLPFSTWVVLRDRAVLDRALLLRLILPVMGLGVLVGGALSGVALLEGPWLRRLFGLLVMTFAVAELWRLRRGEVEAPSARREEGGQGVSAFTRFWLLAAGVVHGIYGTGGPLVVTALGRARLPRTALRATLQAIWLLFGASLVGLALARAQWSSGTTRGVLLLLPAVPLGGWVGHRLHHAVPERTFRLVVNCVLLLAGAALLR